METSILHLFLLFFLMYSDVFDWLSSVLSLISLFPPRLSFIISHHSFQYSWLLIFPSIHVYNFIFGFCVHKLFVFCLRDFFCVSLNNFMLNITVEIQTWHILKFFPLPTILAIPPLVLEWFLFLTILQTFITVTIKNKLQYTGRQKTNKNPSK